MLGAIECTHIPIQNPGGLNGGLFRNRKGYCSINVQMVYDEKSEITMACWPGSTHDSRIWDNSQLCALLGNQTYEGYLLGDNGYPCRSYLMTLLLTPQTPAERRYNSCHIAGRGVIERVFGVWKKRFPYKKDRLRRKLDNTLTITVAVAVLCYFGKRCGDKLHLEADEGPHEDRENDQEHYTNPSGNAVRRTLTQNHFSE